MLLIENIAKIISKEYKLYNKTPRGHVARILTQSYSSQLDELRRDRRSWFTTCQSTGGEGKCCSAARLEPNLAQATRGLGQYFSSRCPPVKWLDYEIGAIVGPRVHGVWQADSAVRNDSQPPKQVPLCFNGLPRGPTELPRHWRRKACRSGNNRRHAGRQCPDSGSGVPFPRRRPIADPSFRSSGD